MFKNSWNGAFAPLAITVFGLLIIAFVYLTFAYSKGYQRSDQDHQADYESHYIAQSDYEECLAKLTIKEAVACTKSTDEAYRENRRAEQDLDAQREMANWAEGMFWATMGTLGVTAFGVALVAATLNQTRRATVYTRGMLKEARRTTKEAANATIAANESNSLLIAAHNAEMRPYVYVRPIDIGYVGEGQHPHVDFVITNQGKTPARFVRVSSKVSLQDFPIKTVGLFAHEAKKPSGLEKIQDINPGFDEEMRTVSDEPLSKNDAVNAMNSTISMILVTGRVWYIGTDSHEHFTIFGFWARIRMSTDSGGFPIMKSVKWETESHFSQTT